MERSSRTKLPVKPKQPKKKSGRATTDERGNSIWEWQTDTGSFKRDINTEELERLRNAGLSVKDRAGIQPCFDPYNNSGIAPTKLEEAAKKSPRKVDLRKLSEEIKQGKIRPTHQK
jgi:hypothetical protein